MLDDEVLSSPWVLEAWLRAIAEIQRAVNEDTAAVAVCSLIVRYTCHLLPASAGAIYLMSDDGKELVLTAAQGLDDDYTQQLARMPLDPLTARTPSAQAILGGHLVSITDVRTEPDFDTWWNATAAPQRYCAALATPITFPLGTSLGCLSVYDTPERPFSAEDASRLQLMAEQASIALIAVRRRDRAARLHREAAQETLNLRERGEALRRTSAVQLALLRSVQAGATLASMTQLLADQLEADITVWDAAHRVLSHTGFGDPLGDVEAPSWPPGLSNDQLDRLGPEGLVLTFPAQHATATRCFLSLSGDSRRQGWLEVSGRSAGMLHGDAATGFAVAVQLHLAADRRETDLQVRLGGDLLGALFAPDAESRTAALLERAEDLGHDLRQPQRLILLTNRSSSQTVDLAGVARSLAARDRTPVVSEAWSGRGLIGLLDKALVALLPQTEDAILHQSATVELLRGTAEGLTGGVPLHALVKNDLRRLGDYRSAYRLLVRAATLLGPYSPAVLDVDDFGLYGVLLDAAPGETLTRFAKNLLAPLHAESTSGQALLVTLRTWYAVHLSTTACAERLYVHRNTVSYRLRRAQKLLGLNLSRPEDALQLQLALIVDHLSGL